MKGEGILRYSLWNDDETLGSLFIVFRRFENRRLWRRGKGDSWRFGQSCRSLQERIEMFGAALKESSDLTKTAVFR